MIARRRAASVYDYWDSPLEFQKNYWPHITLYDKQREILLSMVENDETFVPAANEMGKDFVAGLAVLWFFLTRHPCRILTTSVSDRQLEVLWGEIGRFIQESRVPLDSKRGGPLVVNHRFIRKIVMGDVCPLSVLRGAVAEKGESLQGRHIGVADDIPRELLVVDEASGVEDTFYDACQTWAKRTLVISNCWPCSNFLYRAVKGDESRKDSGGDILRPSGRGYYRKVIKIDVEDSPNIRYARKEVSEGKEPSDKIVVPGLMRWREYQKHLTMWDPIQQKVCLWAEFDEGEMTHLVPPEWLDLSAALSEQMNYSPTQYLGRRAMGVDPAAGGDNTAFCIVDPKRMLHLEGVKTSDTTLVVDRTLDLMREYAVAPEDVAFDIGGEGKAHADRLRRMGKRVRVVNFGSRVVARPRHGVKTLSQRVEEREEQQAFKNRRAQLYWMIRTLLAPVVKDGQMVSQFAIPSSLLDRRRSDGGPSLRQQLVKVPLKHDGEGIIYLPPKNSKTGNPSEETMVKLIGCSPDESDAFGLAAFSLTEKHYTVTAGAA